MSEGQHLRGFRRSTFIVRVDRDDQGGISGVIERVRTGAKEAFRGVEAISGVIARMVEAEGVPPAPRPQEGE
jgi:hypothetical protein